VHGGARCQWRRPVWVWSPIGELERLSTRMGTAAQDWGRGGDWPRNASFGMKFR
jgi:hypothetical protein